MRGLVVLVALLCAPAAQAQTLAQLSWLEGCWRTAAPTQAESGPIITEVWVAPPMPAMLGYSYTVGEGEVQGWEQTRIEMIDGWPYFMAMPNGGAPVRFRLRDTRIHDGAFIDNPVYFDNPGHDYPQTVSYHRVGDLLMARISGPNDSDPIQFVYHAIACDAALIP